MITATGLELRAGSRILLSDTTLRVQPGDRIGLVGRNGAGKTTTLKVLAGEGQPYAGQIDRRSADRLPAAGPAHRRPGGHRPDRVLSARGLDVLMAEMNKLEAAARRRRRRQAGPPLRRPGGPVRRPGRLRRRGRGGPDLRQPRAARPGARPDDRHPLRRPAAAHRAGPDPVPRRRRERRRHPAARRADQPPRRRLDRLAARLPRQPQGRPDRDQPRRFAAGVGGQQGLVPGRHPLRGRPLQPGLEGVPRGSGRPTSGGGAASGPTPRRRPAR